MKTLTISPTLSHMEQALAFVESALRAQGCPSAVTGKLCVAADELLSNIARHSGATEATIVCDTQSETAKLVFLDNGASFDPTAVAEPDTTLSATERKLGGLGVLMVRRMTTGMAYERRDGLNVLTVWKDFANE